MHLEAIVLEKEVIQNKTNAVVPHMQNLKNKTNLQLQQKRNQLTDTENKLVVPGGEREGEGQYRGGGLFCIQ